MIILFFEVHPASYRIGIPVLVFLLILQWLRKRSAPYLLCFFLFSVYLLTLLDVVFLPIQIPTGWPEFLTIQHEQAALSRVNLVPFYFGGLFELSLTTIFWELAGNMLLTLPLGFILPFLVPVTTRKMLWIGLLTGFVLEAAQLVISLLGWTSHTIGHSVDINDLLLNASGVFMGYGVFRLAMSIPWVQTFQKNSVK